MTGLKTSSCCIAVLALLGCFLSCAPVRTRASRNTFVSPSPRTDGAPLITADPPTIESTTEFGDTPRFLSPGQTGAAGARVDALVREAEWHFQAGRRLYEQGEEAGARREFDRAVDILLSAPETPNAVRPAFDKKLDELVNIIHRLDLAGLGSGDTASEPAFEKPPLEDIPELTFPVDPKLKNKVAEQLRATVSQLPLEVTDPVLSFINYFSTERGRKLLLAGLRRGGRYRPLIQRIFDEEGIPQELIFMAQAESGFLPRAVSRKSATGMWQFMLLRGREYSLNQSPYMDDRLDPEKATRAAARHLRDLYHRYGDWYLAMAAYNCGPGVIDKAVERTGYADFWELRRRNTMPRDTASYVPAILAMTIMVKNGKEYGLENLDVDPPLEYDTVDITAPTHLQLVADLAECPVSQLRELNPALLKNIVPAGVPLRVPKGTANAFAASLNAIPAQKRAAWRAHRIAGGETLAAIAHRYRVTEDSIASVNRAAAAGFEQGDLLIIPAAAEQTSVVRVSHKRPAHRTVAGKSGARRRASAASAHRHGRAVTVAANIPPHRGKRSSIKR